MQDAVLKSIFDWNPWLEGKFPKSLAGIPRPAYEMTKLLQLPEIKILEGARRVGKSTLLYQLIEQLTQANQKVLYLNFDDEALSQYSLSDIYHVFIKRNAIDYLFLDEIQHCKEWVHFIRKLYDTKQLKQIWLSGSNSSLLKKEYKTLLSGRNITKRIDTLSFREYLSFKNIIHPELPASSGTENQLIRHIEDYINFGAFPAMALRDFYQKELLINYFEDMIFKDIVTRHDVNSIKIKELGTYLASQSTKSFSYRSIGNTLNIHPKTVSEYISYFHDVYLFSELYKFDYSLKQQLSGDKKIYAIDTGLAAANAFKFSNDAGRMLENVVYTQLRRQHNEIYFHKQKKECDFLIKTELAITDAIQVCYALDDEKTRTREINGLLDALDYFNLNTGLILTMYEEETIEVSHQSKTYQITILPVWKWLLQKQ